MQQNTPNRRFLSEPAVFFVLYCPIARTQQPTPLLPLRGFINDIDCYNRRFEDAQCAGFRECPLFRCWADGAHNHKSTGKAQCHFPSDVRRSAYSCGCSGFPDDEVRVITITSAGGRAFAAGSDLSEVIDRDFRKST